MPKAEKPQSQGVQYLTIDADHVGQRLDNFLISTLKGVPKGHIYRLLRKGEVRVNKGRRRADYRLQDGDELRLPPVRRGQATTQRDHGDWGWLEQCLLYEDEQLLAVNKPHGLAVHGGSGIRLGLIEALRQLRPQQRFLELVHRLDRGTSGVLLVAKTRVCLLALHEQLRSGAMDKRYLALVRGRWQGGERIIEAALRRDQLRSGEREVVLDPAGKPARTGFTPQRYFTGPTFSAATLMAIELFTGRTHQARVHAVASGHPIAGDSKYGDAHFNQALSDYGLQRLFLHAASLSFVHPQQDCTMRIEAPLSPELNVVLERLADAEKV